MLDCNTEAKLAKPRSAHAGTSVERARILGAEHRRAAHVEGALVGGLSRDDAGVCGTAPDVDRLLVVDARLGEDGARAPVRGLPPARSRT
jgi:hypothetical protein